MIRMAANPRPSSPDPSPFSNATAEQGYYSVAEAAALLGVSRMSIWRWVRAGRLPAARLGPRTTRIRRADLERALLEDAPGQPRGWVTRQRAAAGGPERGPTDWREIGPSEHVVQFYEADAVLLDAVAEFIGAALRAGEAGLVVATEAHRAGIEARLGSGGLAVEAARAHGRYRALDAAELLARFMVDGAPEPERFRVVVGGIVASAAEAASRVCIFGEMVALLVAAENYDGAVRLEGLWNDLQRARPFTLFCAYPMDRLAGSSLVDLLGRVCTQHARVIPAESFAALEDPDDRLREIARLQQRAASLEAEIEQRKRAERDRERLLEQEQLARTEAESALRLRDEFLSIASHELRTPLATLKAQAQLALRRFEREGRLDPDRAVSALQAIAGQATTLSRLLDQLLDISRLEAGKLTLEPRPIDLVDLVERAVAGARARTDRHVVTLTAPPSLRAEVDPLRIEQVLGNLLENAIKYSPDGGPIEVALWTMGDGPWTMADDHLRSPIAHRPSSAVIAVRDRGLGIPPEKRGQIFERFYQAHAHGYRSGMGLGLYISRQIVELHGGEIRPEFPADGGTRFVVSLPIGSPKAFAAVPDAGACCPST